MIICTRPKTGYTDGCILILADLATQAAVRAAIRTSASALQLSLSVVSGRGVNPNLHVQLPTASRKLL